MLQRSIAERMKRTPAVRAQRTAAIREHATRFTDDDPGVLPRSAAPQIAGSITR
jgi:hypothetical protein